MPFWLLIAALAGLVGVALDAIGAHALDEVTADKVASYGTATRYQLVHALALLAVAWLADRSPGARIVWMAGSAFTVGIILFCGSIYLNVLFGIEDLEAAPVGGICLLAGWGLLAVQGALMMLRRPR
jgi:uncharacterized membrane protein YgdD (TMEM256/DUF423 family)